MISKPVPGPPGRSTRFVQACPGSACFGNTRLSSASFGRAGRLARPHATTKSKIVHQRRPAKAATDLDRRDLGIGVAHAIVVAAADSVEQIAEALAGRLDHGPHAAHRIVDEADARL